MSGIYEIAILGRATWQLHSLNNEGTVGNVTEPRSVRIIDPNTKKAVTTDGISGEMLKHIHTEIMWALDDKNNLCDACKVLNPEKFNFAIKTKKVTTKDVEDALKQALETCDICDVQGFLLERPTASRKSTVEFGWALGIPEVYRDIHTHARHALGEKGRGGRNQENEGETEGVSTQMVYHRPTRSGVYAVISVFQPWRIGLNEVRQSKYTYDADDSARERRYKLALKAYQLLFARPEGAMTTTRLPHVEDFSGVIVYSTEPIPVPIISPLKNDYVNEIKTIAESLDASLKVVEFDGIADFAIKIGQLTNNKPYEMEF
ncbi:CRISPR-associated autoregulator, Csa2 family [Archaeoglobus sulfaticallidus PM70-1]|uniref:CRISPR-associated autoregulator, Csa2 family n=1 Tax=Archaeoglobus sulfaticallidus PM70-1 TaxID=387631 RepID=N0BE08_9EURY|nr:DevR family CRISPR-associated autoregulator [Archaeoglobus sulfaticallidus]AGK61248.1 CRISPR-associated autoregulator, Csa2 family [Archaeoglobus sulfaticallidus PM70-1]